MIAPAASHVCQRWNARRERYRPVGEVFDPSRASVYAIDEQDAKAFVVAHHYSGSFPAARFRFGLYWKDRFGQEGLAGVAVFGVSMNQRAIPSYFDELAPNDGVELSRLVLLDHLAANAESWFLGRAFRLLKAGAPQIRGVLSYADPLPRLREDGSTVTPGHVGCIYQAHNARYLGRSSARSLLVSRDGRVFSQRSATKIRREERGAAYAVRQLISMGAPAPLPLEAPERYLLRAVREGGFRRMPHPGNHVYAWWLGQRRAEPERLRAPMPYPKKGRS